MDTESMNLEQVQAALEAENEEWKKAGLGLPMLHPQAVAQILFDLQIKVQALINALVLNGGVDEKEMNLQYKRIMLNDMRQLREAAPEAQRRNIREEILRGVHLPNGMPSKPPWER